MSEQLRIFMERLPACRRGPTAAAASAATTLKLVLPFEQRQKARQRARITEGFEVGIRLPRGTVLRGGDQLRGADGTVLPDRRRARDRLDGLEPRPAASRAGGVPLGQPPASPWDVRHGLGAFLADHVLDGMVAQLGLTVIHHDEPFEPEAGPYSHHRARAWRAVALPPSARARTRSRARPTSTSTV